MSTSAGAERLTSPPQPIRLLFSSHEEFIEELRQRGPNLEPIVRVTFRKSPDSGGVPLTHLTLLATYLRRVDDGTGPAAVVTVVQLAEYPGSLWIDPTDQDSRRCQERADLLRAAVVRAVGELGLRVGGGAYLAGKWSLRVGAGSG
ncbi:MAG: hypothetical protein AB7G34_17025 [Hyphomicrobiales bacterium]